MKIKKLNFLEKKLFTKHDLLLQFAKNNNVVHYGCIDDSFDIIDSKMSQNYYLHKLITDNSSKCIGFDINKNGVDYLFEKYGIDNIYYGNVENPESFNIDKSELLNTDVLLIPDLIEHINNPGMMLESITKYYPKHVKVYIITPNPFSYLNFVFTLFNREFYNVYHTCYFSTNNMNVLLSNNGFKINKVYPCYLPKDRGWFINTADKIINHFLTIFTYGFCDNYVYECEIK